MTYFIDDYDDLTVDEVAERLADSTFSQLDEVRSYEVENKNRVTLLEIIDDKLNEVTTASGLRGSESGTADREETANGSGSVSDDGGKPRVSNDGGNEGDVRSDGNSRDRGSRNAGIPEPVEQPTYGDTVEVRYAGPGPGQVAGHWFDAPDTRSVTYTRRVEKALGNGLELTTYPEHATTGGD